MTTDNFAPFLSTTSEKTAYTNLTPQEKENVPEMTGAEFIRYHLCSDVIVDQEVEIINNRTGEREMVEIAYRVMNVREIQKVRESALSKLKSANKNIGDSENTKKYVDSMIGDEMNLEFLYRSCFKPGTEGKERLFPSLEDAAKMTSGNMISFVKNFWDVQAKYSPSRSSMTESELEYWTTYLTTGLKEGGNIGFLVLSLTEKGFCQFLTHLGNQLLKSQTPSNSSMIVPSE